MPDLPPDASVLILGTGLTMVDQVLTLLDGGIDGPITAISRRGLLPRAHRPTVPLKIGPQDIPFAAPFSTLCGWLRAIARKAEQQGGTWRDAMDAVRPYVRRIWRSLSPVERARFLRHGQRWWDIHRHRMPPGFEARILAAMGYGQLTLKKGEVQQVVATPGGITARHRPFRDSTEVVLNATLAIDARGLRGRPADSPVLARLLDKGSARMDLLGIGLDIAQDGSVIRADGTPSSRLWAIGPVSRAAVWEITAVPDIREQAASMAKRIAWAAWPDGSIGVAAGRRSAQLTVRFGPNALTGGTSSGKLSPRLQTSASSPNCRRRQLLLHIDQRATLARADQRAARGVT